MAGIVIHSELYLGDPIAEMDEMQSQIYIVTTLSKAKDSYEAYKIVYKMMLGELIGFISDHPNEIDEVIKIERG